ncbi:MAG TPA: acylphosphatase [Candidatus Krumholzibacteria bacterium]|nr:acylphosphatase [Candidatus Krumholzibacteria bacterium]
MGSGGDTAALHAWVSGRVQGVFFRDSTRREALALCLAGWVRNLPDGRVEVLFVGSRTACERALAFVRTGPPAASVVDVEWVWEAAPDPPPAGFAIR